MGLVDAQVVDAGGLEGDARVLGRIQLGADPFLGAQQYFLQLLDRDAVTFLRRGDPVAQLVQFPVHIGLLLGCAERDALERGPGHDDAVPGAGGAARDKLAAPVPLQVFLPGEHHLGLRVQLQPFAGELLEHVVRDDDGGLADQAEAAQLGDAHDHFRGFPGADLVGEQDGRLADDPGDGGDLMRVGPERQRQAGQRQPGVVVAAQHQVVEPVVVGAGQRGGAGRVLPGPVGEPPGQLGGLLLRGQGRVHVQHRPLLPGRCRSPCRGPGWRAVRARPGRAAARDSGWCPRWSGRARCPRCRGPPRSGRRDARPAGPGHRALPAGTAGHTRRRSRPRRAARRSPRPSGRPGSPGAARRR